MAVRFILTGYVNQLMNQAVYDKLEGLQLGHHLPVIKGINLNKRSAYEQVVAL
jgi:hypothetical protein